MNERRGWLRRCRKEDEEFEALQGDDTGSNTHYADKTSHKKRSIANQPRHKNHWKKEKNK